MRTLLHRGLAFLLLTVGHCGCAGLGETVRPQRTPTILYTPWEEFRHEAEMAGYLVAIDGRHVAAVDERGLRVWSLGERMRIGHEVFDSRKAGKEIKVNHAWATVRGFSLACATASISSAASQGGPRGRDPTESFDLLEWIDEAEGLAARGQLVGPTYATASDIRGQRFCREFLAPGTRDECPNGCIALETSSLGLEPAWIIPNVESMGMGFRYVVGLDNDGNVYFVGDRPERRGTLILGMFSSGDASRPLELMDSATESLYLSSSERSMWEGAPQLVPQVLADGMTIAALCVSKEDGTRNLKFYRGGRCVGTLDAERALKNAGIAYTPLAILPDGASMLLQKFLPAGGASLALYDISSGDMIAEMGSDRVILVRQWVLGRYLPVVVEEPSKPYNCRSGVLEVVGPRGL